MWGFLCKIGIHNYNVTECPNKIAGLCRRFDVVYKIYVCKNCGRSKKRRVW